MRALSFASICVLAFAGCFNAVGQGGGGGGGSSTGGGGSATGGGAATGGGGAATGGGGSATGGGGGGAATGGGGTATGGGTGTGGGSGDGGMGDTCGGFAGTTCGAGFVCIHMDKSCGAADGTGTCQPRPGGCPDVYLPVCGCDGVVYGNECDANAAGVDVSVNNGCTPPSGMFGCGWGFCSLSSTYCLAEVGGVAGNPGSYSCTPLPSGCGMMADCACLQNETCGGACTGTGGSGLRLTCYTP